MGDPLAYVRAVHFAATIIAAGVVIFEVTVAMPAFTAAAGVIDRDIERLRSRWAWLVWVSLAVAAASGVIWISTYFQVGAEAVLPVNHASGTGVGFLGQLHLYLDDMFPTTIGKPLFGGPASPGRPPFGQ